MLWQINGQSVHVDVIRIFGFCTSLLVFRIVLISSLTLLTVTAYSIFLSEEYLPAILTSANIQLPAVYRKAETIEEVHKCSVGYSVYIVTVISTYYYLIILKAYENYTALLNHSEA